MPPTSRLSPPPAGSAPSPPPPPPPPRPPRPARPALDPDAAGEDDREQYGQPAAPALAQLAHDVDAREQAVIHVRPQPRLQGLRMIGERRVRIEVNGQQLDRGEVAHDLPHLGVNLRAVEHGEVQRELLLAAPPADH